ncbi:hypothetical protein Tco_1087271 [Tanacetum coccineum]
MMSGRSSAFNPLFENCCYESVVAGSCNDVLFALIVFKKNREMPIEFVILLNEMTFPVSQVIPEVYNEEAFIDNHEIYIVSSEGYRYKVKLVNPDEGCWYLTGGRWTEFCNRSLNVDASLLHFVEEGDDFFYVTGYNRDGIEFGGYGVNRSTFSRFMTRVLPYPHIPHTLPAGFLPNLDDVDEIEICVNGVSVMFDFCLKRKYSFNNNGSALTEVFFKGSASLRRVQLPLTASEQC